MSDEDIAIIGMSCRVPGAPDLETFWGNLKNGVESLQEVTSEMLDRARVPEKLRRDPAYVRSARVLPDADAFDASFFYLSRREAELMDPQLRVFLETAWNALEHAGHSSEDFAGTIGVYAAQFAPTYLLGNLFLGDAGGQGRVDQYMQNMQARMGNDCNYLATRTSYHLNLTGPSMAVQTACSSSLVAVHLAAQAIRAGECDMAVAGGVSIRFPQEVGYLHERDGISSPDGRCRPFDADANGTVFGNGVGVVVVRRLSDAIANGDRIWAVVRGSAVGNEGAKRVGFAAPSVDGQVAVLAEAVAASGLQASDVSFVEAHGTGTAMGDPIEFAALREVYGEAPRCALGSVKANVGHLSVAAGVIGLIKVALMLHHRTRVPTPNFRAFNPKCEAESSPFVVETERAAWVSDRPLVAGVSSFGMGGTNCHVVLAQAPQPAPAPAGRPLQLLPVSAKSPEALDRAVRALSAIVEPFGLDELADASHTLARGRRTFNFRRVVVAGDGATAARALEVGDPKLVVRGEGAPEDRPVVFMFPGQGAQHPGMAAGCYAHEPVYREVFDRCAALAQPILGADLADLLYPSERGLARKRADLKPTELAQPALFMVEYALAELWKSWGIAASAMIGHSVGEYVAACQAGVMALETAVTLVCMRGKLVAELPAGDMAAVLASAERVRPMLGSDVAVAAVNERGSCTIAGPAGALAAVLDRLDEAGLGWRKLPTSHAFHSAMMDPAVAKLEALFDGVELSAPRLPFVSNLTGTWITDAQATDPAYWARHLREAVEFDRGLGTLLAWQACVYLEVGPGQALASFARRHEDREPSVPVLTSLGRAQAPEAGYENLLLTLGRFWALGQRVAWADYFAAERRGRVPLPAYPFEHQAYWVEPVEPGALIRDDEPRRLAPEDWVYARRWREAPRTSRRRGAADAGGSIVFVSDLAGCAALLEALGALGDVVTVRAGAAFEARTDGGFTIRPDAAEDMAQLFVHLRETGRDHARLVHTLLLSPGAPYAPHLAHFEAVQGDGLFSLIALARSLATITVQRDLIVLTSGVHSITGHEATDPARATASVAAKVIRQEYPHLRARAVDLDGAELAADSLALRAVLDELRAPVPGELEVAIRGRRRWLPDFGRVVVGDLAPDAARLKRGGRYLITGGLGQIGVWLAEHLASGYEARLILLVHEALPPRERWDDDELRASLRSQIAHARRLEAAGVEVLIEAGDVGDVEAVRRALAAADARFGGIDGVFHLAGRPGERWDRVIAETDREVADWHFQAKARGQIALEQALAARPLDFVLCFSSLAGIAGGLRLLPYGAANHFMDAAADRLRDLAARTAWFSVGWDVWQHHQDEKRALSGIGAMMDDKTVLTQDGLRTIERILALPEGGYYAVSTWDLPLRLARWLDPLGAASATAPDGPGEARADDDGGPSAYVQALLSKALGVAQLDPDQDIFELGADSLMIVQLLAQVRTQRAVDVSLADFLNQATPRALARLIGARTEHADPQDGWTSRLPFEDPAVLERLVTEIELLSEAEVAHARSARGPRPTTDTMEKIAWTSA
jgi:phthiocerol/phenolphthiocerol synthesis type-I polyketide synthase E